MFIMMIGLPGSGKSTYAKTLDGVVLSSDEIRKDIGNPWNEMFRRTIELLKSGENVIYDATNLFRKKRRAVITEAKRYGKTKAVVMLTPLNECLERNSRRVEKVPTEVIWKFEKNFEYPAPYEFDEVEVVQNGIERVSIHDMPQDNPHHTLSLFEHMRKTGEIARTMTEDRGVITAAALHDIGKYYTKTYMTFKGDFSEVAHYYGHENVGAYMWLTSREFSPKVEKIGRLINYHMRPFCWDSPKAQLQDAKDFGRMYEELELIHKADVEAK